MVEGRHYLWGCLTSTLTTTPLIYMEVEQVKLLDRLALIKAGYTKKEIAEIEQMETVSDVGNDAGDGLSTPEPEESQDETDTDETDYKAEYVKLSEQVADLQSKLAEAQKVNINTGVDIPTPPDPQEQLNKIIEEFL